MGMFKDMGDAFKVLRSDELKDLKRKADAQPKVSMLDGIKLANQAVDQAQVWQQQGAGQMQGLAGMAGAAGIATSGIAGSATVASLADTGTMVNNAPVMEMDLTVTVPGREPYSVKHRQLVAFAAMGNFQPGSTFPVHVDQQDPSKLVIG
jgi:hypothetical protein